MIVPLLMSVVLTLQSQFVMAKATTNKHVSVSNGYTNVVRPGQGVIAVYFDVINNSSKENVYLVKATSPFAESIELHSMQIFDNVMKMKIEQKISIPANSKISLGKGNPKGYHLMLQNVSPEIINREEFTLVLTFSNGDTIPCEIPINKHDQNTDKHH